MWVFGKRSNKGRQVSASGTSRRRVRAESLEPRCLMAADALHVGLVYLETDYLDVSEDQGTDSLPDRFILSFTGGAPQSELAEVRISTDKDQDGLTVGDLIFDTAMGGRGKGGAHGFTLISLQSANPSATVTALVDDGGTELVLQMTNFVAGDRLEFSLDIDEVLRLSNDLDLFNSRLDVIASGQEFQDSILSAKFVAPHYEVKSLQDVFLNDYGDPEAAYGLALPPDVSNDVNSRPNRSAAAIISGVQNPKPISIAGTVFVDNDLNLVQGIDEVRIAGVELQLWKRDEVSSDYIDTTFRATTNIEGHYSFGTSLGLMPGTYRVVQVQPQGYFSVGAIPGSIGDLSATVANPSGSVESVNALRDIALLFGDTHAIRYDFAEAQASEIHGYVYRDDSDDGFRDSNEVGIADVEVQLIPLQTIAPQDTLSVRTLADGSYAFLGLVPGVYRIIQPTQPQGYADGLDTAGKVSGIEQGSVVNPGDSIESVQLIGGLKGTEYNFGELPFGSLEGTVFIPAPGETCLAFDPSAIIPVSGATVRLYDASGQLVGQTTSDQQGRYRFERLPKGVYRIEELTPDGLFDGRPHLGSIDGIELGVIGGDGSLTTLQLGPGQQGIDFDFCELAPVSVSGNVYHDASNDGRFDSTEIGIQGATVHLRDDSGNHVATAKSDANGFYRFTNLAPGQYQLLEETPDGYLDGLDTAGTISGMLAGTGNNPGDSITGIVLVQGQKGEQYNFGELRPSTIQGRVTTDIDGNCEVLSAGEIALKGVELELLDSLGRVIGTAMTDAEGRYTFGGLAPGNYSVRQIQPEGYFEGGQRPGTSGGDPSIANLISSISVGSGVVSTDNDFCEHPPAELSGKVFADRNANAIHEFNEPLLNEVVLELLDPSGVIVATTMTDSSGQYSFLNLRKGIYEVRQTQPVGYFHGGQAAGSAGGYDVVDDRIQGVVVSWGEKLIDYDFYELEPVSLSGRVFIDRDDDCRFDPSIGEYPLEGTRIELLDLQGDVVGISVTDRDGRYRFDKLPPGVYALREEQPSGFFQGGQMPGTAGGDASEVDIIKTISLASATNALDYDFCERDGATLSGRVWEDVDRDQVFDSNEIPLGGITIELLNVIDEVVAETTTDGNGDYRFENLEPGIYAVRETQPTSLFHGGQVRGSHGGDDSQINQIRSIRIPGGAKLIHYDFPELPAATISGYVFQDGPALRMRNAPPAEQLRDYQDGVRTADDRPLAGVFIELRNNLGLPMMATSALAGVYPEGPIRTKTDENGYYEFSGLNPTATYHVYQVQPDGFVDGLDTSGSSTVSLAMNAADLQSDPLLVAWQTFLASNPASDPRNDAILVLTPGPGEHWQNNNFSEILLDPPVGVIPEDPRSEVSQRITEVPDTFHRFTAAYDAGMIQVRPLEMIGTWGRRVTWHLSVINGGAPRGAGLEEQQRFLAVAAEKMDQWGAEVSNRGVWRRFDIRGEEMRGTGNPITIGVVGGLPLVGDFNGDGKDETAIYVNGQWLIDLNGNGAWDPSDLWVQLGSEVDRPVVGDWDGDGKADVGIFGPEWARDAEVIPKEPGLPGLDNKVRHAKKNLPPQENDATIGQRLLRKTTLGKMRSDMIDHVFRYGEEGDYPLSGDWDGDGIDTIAVFNAGKWQLDLDGDGKWNDRDVTIDFGQPGDIPIVGDWNGDGIDELAVVRGDLWIIDSDGDRRITAADTQVMIERGENEVPIAGDWDGDGTAEPGIYRTEGRSSKLDRDAA